MKLRLRIVSDLHIESWNATMYHKYPYNSGARAMHPLDLCNKTVSGKANGKVAERDYASILIVAGDTSDDFECSLQYLSNNTNGHSHVLFIDGNHESTVHYPELLSCDDMFTTTQNIDTRKLEYLPRSPFTFESIAFVGACGWWDYQDGANTQKHSDYFNHWIDDMPSGAVADFHENVLQKSREEYDRVVQQLEQFHTNGAVSAVVLITHTIPHRRFCTDNNCDFFLNSKFESITKLRFPKITHWIFGHVHEQYDEVYDGVRYVCHPRGRVDDYNRADYSPKVITIFEEKN